MSKSNRKSGVRRKSEILSPDEILDLSDFIKPYIEFKKEYSKLVFNEKEKAYIVTYVSDSSLAYVAFTENKDKAKSIATKYFRDSFYPTFMGSEWKKRYNECRARRVKEWDIYHIKKKVPVTELMKIGASFPCYSCGGENFTYSDYENKRCFIIEDEGDTNPFIKGFVVCYNCYKKFFSQ